MVKEYKRLKEEIDNIKFYFKKKKMLFKHGPGRNSEDTEEKLS